MAGLTLVLSTLSSASAKDDFASSFCTSGSHINNGMPSTSFRTYFYGVGQSWDDILGNGPFHWNDRVGIANLTHTTVSNPFYARRATVVQQPANSLTGWYSPLGSNSFEIVLNRPAIEAWGAQNNLTLGQAGRRLAVHEFGHALSLRDNPPGGMVSIMRYSNMPMAIPPWPHDVACVNDFYLN